jgi:DNA (cytosine-5)-methyltransferase 1
MGAPEVDANHYIPQGGCYWNGEQVAAALTRKGCDDRMPDKERLFAVLQPTTVRSGSIGGFVQDDVGGTMRANGGDYHGGSESLVVWPAEVAATLDRSSKNSGGPGGSNQEIFSQHGANLVPQPVPYDLFQITAPVNRQNRKPGDPCHTLARDNAAHAAIAIQRNLVGRETGGPQGVGASTDGAMYTLTKADTHAVAFDWQSGGDSRGLDPKDTAQLQRCQTPAVHHAMTVRRLTPVECERLQGFPDNWTAIPWRKKTAEECPDGPRYKALGNSMACNCMAWIGERIAAYEQRGRVDPTPAGTAGIAPAGDLNHEGDRHG